MTACTFEDGDDARSEYYGETYTAIQLSRLDVYQPTLHGETRSAQNMRFHMSTGKAHCSILTYQYCTSYRVVQYGTREVDLLPLYFQRAVSTANSHPNLKLLPK